MWPYQEYYVGNFKKCVMISTETYDKIVSKYNLYDIIKKKYLWWESLVTCGFPYKGQVLQKVIPWHDIIMTMLYAIWLAEIIHPTDHLKWVPLLHRTSIHIHDAHTIVNNDTYYALKATQKELLHVRI